MDKKQKKTLLRIIIAAVMFAALLILEHTGDLDKLPNLLVFALYLIPYLIIGYDVIHSAFRSIRRGKAFDEHFLMSIATLAAFGLGLLGEGEYPEALAVMLFYQIGELFQSYAVGKSRRSIAEMMELAPEYANLEADGSVEEVDPEDVHINDVILIKPGEKIPLDGIVIEGDSFVDTAALTGESVPRRVRAGEEVISGCVNGEAVLRVKVTKEYEDSTVAKVLDLVETASTKKAKLENFITRFARYYTPIVTICAVLLAVITPLLLHVPLADGIRRACNFLIVSCPCALVISIPLGFFGGIGAASKIGVLIKGSNYLEAASQMSTVVMDKTGTLTKGEFRVKKVVPYGDYSEPELLEIAAHGEGLSTHPIARSIHDAYGKNIDMSKIGEAIEIAGHGIKIRYLGKELLLGNAKLMEENGIGYTNCGETGTVIYIAYGTEYIGCIVISDTVKDGAREAIADMKKAGIRNIVMLTGDSSQAADAVAKEIGIDEVRAELLPAGKVTEVERLIDQIKQGSQNEKLGFVGDGINDAPVLVRSDVGIAMGSLGSDAAIEAADIVLMDDDIRKIPATIRIARKTMGIVKCNVAFALIVKFVILILSAVGAASMWAAVFGDVGVSIICIFNAMRALNIK